MKLKSTSPFGEEWTMAMMVPPAWGGKTYTWKGSFASREKAFARAAKEWQAFQVAAGPSAGVDPHFWRAGAEKTSSYRMEVFEELEGVVAQLLKNRAWTQLVRGLGDASELVGPGSPRKDLDDAFFAVQKAKDALQQALSHLRAW